MTSWEFLRPWVDVLWHFAAVDENKSATFGRSAQESMRRPIEPIRVTFPVDVPHETMKQLGQAMELIGYGLLIDPSLWTVIRKVPLYTDAEWWLEDSDVQQHVEPSLFRDEDLKPSFVINDADYQGDFKRFLQWLSCVAEVFHGVSDSEDPAFLMAKAQLKALDTLGVVADGQSEIPVALRVDLPCGKYAKAVAAMFDTHAAASTASNRTHLRLEYVDVVMQRLNRNASRAARIPVRRAVVEECHAVDKFSSLVSALTNSKSSPTLQSLHLKFDRTRPLTGGQCAAILNGPDEIRIDMPGGEAPDWLMLCRCLQLCRSRPGKRFLELRLPDLIEDRVQQLSQALHMMQQTEKLATWARVNPATASGLSLHAQLLRKKLDASAAMPAIYGMKRVLLSLDGGGELLDVARSSVVLAPGEQTASESAFTASIASLALSEATNCQVGVRLVSDVCMPQRLRTVLSFLETCFGHHLTSLELELGTNVKVSEPAIASILAKFPKLTCLKLSSTELKTMDVFSDAYRSGRSKIRVLSIASGHVGFVPFLKELATPTAIATKTLQELQLKYPTVKPDADADAFLSAVQEMLTHNRFLRYLKLVVATKSTSLVDKVTTSLRKFHRRLIAVATLAGGANASQTGFCWRHGRRRHLLPTQESATVCAAVHASTAKSSRSWATGTDTGLCSPL